MKNYVNTVPSKTNKHRKKILFWFASRRSDEKAGSGTGAWSGSVSEKYGSEDPDPHQNVTDPEDVEKLKPDPQKI
jgi:hypothetical protein